MADMATKLGDYSFKAASCGSVATTDTLLDYANKKCPNSNLFHTANSPLRAALIGGHEDLAAFLLKKYNATMSYPCVVCRAIANCCLLLVARGRAF
jgi:hypothetical protein